MPKPRTKHGIVREERKRKRREVTNSNRQAREEKRRRANDDNQDQDGEEAYTAADAGAPVQQQQHEDGRLEREFFGMLAEEEQEYFRRADEMLELNQFPTAAERDLFLESVFKEAQSKELKLASSQSCSRLMERLIQLSTTRQKKHLFEAFGGHFLSLVQHRFASHCCEALFLRSAGLVSQELAGFVTDTEGAKSAEQRQEPESSMEYLFLATLDELEGSLAFLLTDRFGSHALRVLLLVLSGRPLEGAAAKTLMKSRKKEGVSVPGATPAEHLTGVRAVPASFTTAVYKIMADSTADLDATALRVLAKHPIGNPTLQLLLELDLTLNRAEHATPPLLEQLLPGAPKSLSDPASEASEFVNGMMYDQIGSRLIETLVQHCPGKIFKPLNHSIFLPRVEAYVRNDISCYPAIRALQRLGKHDLVEAVDRITPTVAQLVSKARFNVLNTLFERCAARHIPQQATKLTKALKDACGPQSADLITTLTRLDRDQTPPSARTEYAIQSHGAALLTTMLSLPTPAKTVHASLQALDSSSLLRLANTSLPAVTLLTTALTTPSPNSLFQKTLVSALSPHAAALATSPFGHNLLSAIANVPCRGKDLSVPLHVKESVMQNLSQQEEHGKLRESWTGRSVWRAWKGDMWRTRPMDWKRWMRDMTAPP